MDPHTVLNLQVDPTNLINKIEADLAALPQKADLAPLAESSELDGLAKSSELDGLLAKSSELNGLVYLGRSQGGRVGAP
jgi:hypothetical protein